MRKIFTVLAAALVCLAASAQECPSILNLSVVNGDDASNVVIELQLTNTSPVLFGFGMNIAKAEGSENIQWKKIDRKWFNVDDYLSLLLSDVEIPDGQDITDESFYFSYFELKAYMIHDQLQIKEEYWVPYELYFPVLEEPTGVGKFCVDMSACDDGEYKLVSDHSLVDISMFYKTPESFYVWTIDEPMSITLSKQGNTVTEKSRTAATYVSSLTGVSTVGADSQGDSRIFDLQGRELKGVPEHGIYIQNGKKHVK